MYLFSAFVLHQISVDGIPPDGTTFTVEKEIEKPLTIIMYILAILGMILVSVCIGFTAIFHKTRLILCCGFTNIPFYFLSCHFRLVRLTSPALTMITCSGCCLLYICIFFAAIQSKAILPTSVICNVMLSFLHAHAGSVNTFVLESYLLFHSPLFFRCVFGCGLLAILLLLVPYL